MTSSHYIPAAIEPFYSNGTKRSDPHLTAPTEKSQRTRGWHKALGVEVENTSMDSFLASEGYPRKSRRAPATKVRPVLVRAPAPDDVAVPAALPGIPLGCQKGIHRGVFNFCAQAYAHRWSFVLNRWASGWTFASLSHRVQDSLLPAYNGSMPSVTGQFHGTEGVVRIRRNDDGTQEFMAVMQKTRIGLQQPKALPHQTESIFSGLNIELDSKDHYKFLARETDLGNRWPDCLAPRGKNQITQNDRRGEFRSSGRLWLKWPGRYMKRKSFKHRDIHPGMSPAIGDASPINNRPPGPVVVAEPLPRIL